MNTKLQDTLDTLDILAVSGGREILEEQKINEILQRKLRMSIAYAKDVEKDRDELRGVIEKLVQKGWLRSPMYKRERQQYRKSWHVSYVSDFLF